MLNQKNRKVVKKIELKNDTLTVTSSNGKISTLTVNNVSHADTATKDGNGKNIVDCYVGHMVVSQGDFNTLVEADYEYQITSDSLQNKPVKACGLLKVYKLEGIGGRQLFFPYNSDTIYTRTLSSSGVWGEWKGLLAGDAEKASLADKAKNDSLGNPISTTYATKDEINKIIAISDTAPTVKSVNSLWFDTTSKQIKYWNGTSWIAFSAVYTV